MSKKKDRYRKDIQEYEILYERILYYYAAFMRASNGDKMRDRRKIGEC